MSDYIQTDKAFVLEDYTTLSIDANMYNPGYTFTGWNTSPNGSGTSIAANAIYDPKSDISVYAQWNKEEQPVSVNVYTYNKNYTTTFRQSNGTSFMTTKQTNYISFTQINQPATLEISAPGVMVAIEKNGETIGGKQTYINTDSTTKVKTIPFTISEFTKLNISKIPVKQLISVEGKMPTTRSVYSNAGTIFGGYYYIVHWYDSYTFYNGSPSRYTFNRTDKCFVNIAHLGKLHDHWMHLSCGYYDVQQSKPYVLTSFICNNFEQSPANELTNYVTLRFNELSIDLREYPLSNRYYIGYSIRDNTEDCYGIKFRGMYQVYVVDDTEST